MKQNLALTMISVALASQDTDSHKEKCHEALKVAKSAIEDMQKTLSVIAACKGKTLITTQLNEEAYSAGANAAFEECAYKALRGLYNTLEEATSAEETAARELSCGCV